MPLNESEFFGSTMYVVERWQAEGFVHGFGGRAAGGRSELETLRTGLGVEAVLRPKQVHGAAVVDLQQLCLADLGGGNAGAPSMEADALVVHTAGAGRIAAAISTADCVPLILRAPGRAALVHAGWRGLAGGVIRAAFEALGAPGELEAAIGPCACGRCYEVGGEVLGAIGESAQAEPCGAGKFKLDPAATAVAQLCRLGCCPTRIYSAGVCTIEDRRFHSYRRDGQTAGRNLSFIVS